MVGADSSGSSVEADPMCVVKIVSMVCCCVIGTFYQLEYCQLPECLISQSARDRGERERAKEDVYSQPLRILSAVILGVW